MGARLDLNDTDLRGVSGESHDCFHFRQQGFLVFWITGRGSLLPHINNAAGASSSSSRSMMLAWWCRGRNVRQEEQLFIGYYMRPATSFTLRRPLSRLCSVVEAMGCDCDTARLIASPARMEGWYYRTSYVMIISKWILLEPIYGSHQALLRFIVWN